MDLDFYHVTCNEIGRYTAIEYHHMENIPLQKVGQKRNHFRKLAMYSVATTNLDWGTF